jgi:heterodisulfide reductase subunit A-like polyferredoxin
MNFVNYSDGDEHKRVCIQCYEVFRKDQSKRNDFCSRYCAKLYETKLYQLSDAERVYYGATGEKDGD